MEWVPGDYFTKLGAALLTDSGPDIYETTVAAPEAVANNQLADLSDIITPEVAGSSSTPGRSRPSRSMTRSMPSRSSATSG